MHLKKVLNSNFPCVTATFGQSESGATFSFRQPEGSLSETTLSLSFSMQGLVQFNQNVSSIIADPNRANAVV